MTGKATPMRETGELTERMGRDFRNGLMENTTKESLWMT